MLRLAGCLLVLYVFLSLFFLPASVAGSGLRVGGGSGASVYHGWYRVFFMPRDAERALDFVLYLLDNATESIYFTAYGFSLRSVADALIDAHDRGVDVRLVTDGDHYDDSEIQRLISNGVPVVAETGRGIMHNKFVVIDHRIVVTGSTNWHWECFSNRHNNMIIVKHPEVASRYEAEFMEMWSGTFHGGAPTENPDMYIWLNDSLVEVHTYFGPDDDPADKLLSLMDSAETRVYFMSLIFTRDDLAEKLVELDNEGLRVMGIHDNGEANNPGSKYKFLRDNNVYVTGDGDDMILHNKIFIVDGAVWTGSMNPSYSGTTRNDENVLVIRDPRLASLYVGEFNYIWSSYSVNITVDVYGPDGSPVTGALVEASLGDWRMRAYTINGSAVIVFPEHYGTVYIEASYRGLHGSTTASASASHASIQLSGSPVGEHLYINEFSHRQPFWIEIYNGDNSSINLGGYTVTAASKEKEGMEASFPQDAVIEPGQHLVVAERADLYRELYGADPDYEIVDSDPSIPDMVVSGGFALRSRGDEIILLDPSGRVVDAVYYGSSWLSTRYALPAGQPEDESYQRILDGYDTDIPVNDFELAEPTPGAPNNAPPPIPEPPLWLIAAALSILAASIALAAPRRRLGAPAAS